MSIFIYNSFLDKKSVKFENFDKNLLNLTNLTKNLSNLTNLTKNLSNLTFDKKKNSSSKCGWGLMKLSNSYPDLLVYKISQ